VVTGWKIEFMDSTSLRRSPIACAGLAIIFAACGGTAEHSPEGPMTDDVYVSAMVDLLLLDTYPPDTSSADDLEAAKDSARRDILDRHGISAAELLAFANAAGSDPAHMRELWERITSAHDSIRITSLRAEAEARSEIPERPADDHADTARPTGGPRDSAELARTLAPPSSTNRDSVLRSRLRSRRQRPDSTRD
jgi:hypothetical protein